MKKGKYSDAEWNYFLEDLKEEKILGIDYEKMYTAQLYFRLFVEDDELSEQFHKKKQILIKALEDYRRDYRAIKIDKNKILMSMTRRKFTINSLSNFSGINRVLLTKIKNGKVNTLKQLTLSKLAEALKVNVSDLILHDEENIDSVDENDCSMKDWVEELVKKHAALCKKAEDKEERIRWHNAMVYKYMIKNIYPDSVIARKLGISEDTFYSDMRKALDDMMVLAFGIDGIRFQDETKENRA